MTAIETRPPVLPERRVGWWFMRTFRPWEVAKRGAVNEVLAAAWRVNQLGYTDEDHARLFAAIDAHNDVTDRRGRLGRIKAAR